MSIGKNQLPHDFEESANRTFKVLDVVLKVYLRICDTLYLMKIGSIIAQKTLNSDLESRISNGERDGLVFTKPRDLTTFGKIGP